MVDGKEYKQKHNQNFYLKKETKILVETNCRSFVFYFNIQK